MKYGFVRVAAAIPRVRVADCAYNGERIAALAARAAEAGAEIVCFPELALTGYTCQDLFHQQTLLQAADRALATLIDATSPLEIICIVGLPMMHGGALYNVAAVIYDGRLLGVVPKSHIPNYKEFYEQRWFASGLDLPLTAVDEDALRQAPFGSGLLFRAGSLTFGVEICEDLWSPIPPSSRMALQGADVVFNLSASNDLICKHDYLKGLVAQQSARCLSSYVFSSAGYGESTQDVVFGGKAFIYENGALLAEAERFSTDEQLIISDIDVERLRAERMVNTTFMAAAVDALKKEADGALVIATDKAPDSEERPLLRRVNPRPFVPTGQALDERCEEILQIQTAGLMKRLEHTRAQTAVVGVSGGLDSTLALLICVRAFDRLGWERSRIVGITMPGFGTTGRTYRNACDLMHSLGITTREISICEAVTQHFADLGVDSSVHDVTYENCQARERTQILMDAANQMNGLVIGTGDLSELALGWATYNGDHMSMYGVNASIPKTLIRHLVVWAAGKLDAQSRATLLDVADTPISPELLPATDSGDIAQRTEDLVGPYELHDFFLYYTLRFGFTPQKIYYLARQAFDQATYDDATIKHWLTVFCRRFFQQQFKRSCLPDGPKVGSVSLSPRGDWRMPTDASVSEWLACCNEL